MDINSYYSFFNNDKDNRGRILRKKFSINISPECYINKKNNAINDILKFIKTKTILTPNNNNSNFDYKSFSLVLDNDKKMDKPKTYQIYRKNTFSILSKSCSNFNSFYNPNNDKSYHPTNNNSSNKIRQYVYNNYNKVFNNYRKKENNKYSNNPKINKQEEIMRKINNIKENCFEKRKSFIDNESKIKKYQNKISSSFSCKIFNYNSNDNNNVNKYNNFRIYKKFVKKNNNLIEEINYLKQTMNKEHKKSSNHKIY